MTTTQLPPTGTTVTASQPGGHQFTGVLGGPVPGLDGFVYVQHAGGAARVHGSRVTVAR